MGKSNQMLPENHQTKPRPEVWIFEFWNLHNECLPVTNHVRSISQHVTCNSNLRCRQWNNWCIHTQNSQNQIDFYRRLNARGSTNEVLIYSFNNAWAVDVFVCLIYSWFYKNMIAQRQEELPEFWHDCICIAQELLLLLNQTTISYLFNIRWITSMFLSIIEFISIYVAPAQKRAY